MKLLKTGNLATKFWSRSVEQRVNPRSKTWWSSRFGLNDESSRFLFVVVFVMSIRLSNFHISRTLWVKKDISDKKQQGNIWVDETSQSVEDIDIIHRSCCCCDLFIEPTDCSLIPLNVYICLEYKQTMLVCLNRIVKGKRYSTSCMSPKSEPTTIYK